MKDTATTPREALEKTYLCITDVQVLLGMPREPARALFTRVKAKEKERLGEFDVWPTMIQKENLLKAIRITRDQLLQDIEAKEKKRANRLKRER